MNIQEKIKEYLKGKEMKATFENEEIAKSIFGDLLYSETDVIDTVIHFYEEISSKLAGFVKRIDELSKKKLWNSDLDAGYHQALQELKNIFREEVLGK